LFLVKPPFLAGAGVAPQLIPVMYTPAPNILPIAGGFPAWQIKDLFVVFAHATTTTAA